MGFIKKSNATLFLFINAFLWGSSYVWSKMLLGYLSRFSILTLCSLGGLITTLILFFPSIRTIRLNTVAISAGISAFSIISNTFFMFALQYTGSSNTAFIVQTSVIITPVLVALLEKKLPEGRIVWSAISALAGIFLLTCNFSDFRFNMGDLLAFGNALFFSLYLTALNRNSKRIDPVHFTLVHQFTNTVAFLLLAGIFEVRAIRLPGLKSPAFLLLIAASMIISVGTVLIQSTAIKYIRAEKATLIYTFEPVTALWLAYLFIGEKPDGWKSLAGCVLILVSVLYSIYKPARAAKVTGGKAAVVKSGYSVSEKTGIINGYYLNKLLQRQNGSISSRSKSSI